MPNSHRLPPRLTTSARTCPVNSRSGSPAVTKGMSAFRFAARSDLKSSSTADMSDRLSAQPCDFETVLVAAAGEAHDDCLSFLALRGQLHAFGDGVRAFERRQNPLVAREQIEGLEGFVVAAKRILHAPGVFPVAVLG